MGECRSRRECELECLFEEKATKYHEMVPITILRLHNSRRLEARRVHKVEVIGLAQVVVRICKGQLE